MANVAPKDWKAYKLHDLGFVGRGKSRHRPRNDKILYGGKYPFFQTGDVKAANYKLRSYSQTYSEAGLAQSKLWRPGTLLITIAANIADTAILDIDGCFPDSIVGFVADNQKADVRFVKYSIDTLKLQMRNISRGTTQDNLSVDKLLIFNIFAPTVGKQQKIANVLSSYDELIENNSKRIEKLEAMARLLYKDLLNQNDRKDYKISDFVELQNGFAFKSDTFTTNGRFGVITIKNVQDGKFSTDSLSKINFIPERIPEHCKLKKGDILMSLTGNVGRVCIVTKNSMLLNQRVAKLVSDHYALTYCLFRSRSMLTRLENLSNGTAQQNLSPVMTRDLIVSLPGELHIEKFEELCLPILTQIVRLNEKNDILAQARDLLLPRLMSGEIEI